MDDPFATDARERTQRQRRIGPRAPRPRSAIATEVVRAGLDVVKSQAAISALQTALRAAEESYRVTSELFQVGRATPTDVIDAESDLFGAKAQLADARIGSVIAMLQYTHALGRDADPK